MYMVSYYFRSMYEYQDIKISLSKSRTRKFVRLKYAILFFTFYYIPISVVRGEVGIRSFVTRLNRTSNLMVSSGRKFSLVHWHMCWGLYHEYYHESSYYTYYYGVYGHMYTLTPWVLVVIDDKDLKSRCHDGRLMWILTDLYIL